MPRQSKLTPDRIETIKEILQATGKEILAYTAANVSEGTYYRWKSENPEFKELVTQALNEYEQRKKQIVLGEVQEAKDYLLRTLRGEEFTKKIKKDVTGLIIETIEETVKPPSWYLERLVSKDEVNNDFTINVRIANPPEQEDDFDDGEEL